MQCNVIKYSTVLYSQCITVQHSTAQYSMVGHRLTQMWPAPSNINPMLLRYISYCVRTYVTLSEQNVQVSAIA